MLTAKLRVKLFGNEKNLMHIEKNEVISDEKNIKIRKCSAYSQIGAITINKETCLCRAE